MPTNARYNAFLSYNSQDRRIIHEVAGRLKSQGLEVYLEEWEIAPGREFQPALAEGLRDSKTCVVFLGPNGLGPWQKQELQVAIDWAVDQLSREGIRVEGVPVRWARLEDGDRLHVGRYRIRVRHVGPAEAGRGRADVPGADELGPDSSELDIPTLPSDQLPALAGRSPAPSQVTRRSRSERPLPPDMVLEPLTDQFALMQERLFEQHQARFGQMQQQMFEQFHQAMMAMFQMFGTLQREQMGQVHEDLDRIQELTRELQALQAEASRRAAAGPASGLVAASPEIAPGSSPEPDRPQVPATPAGVAGPSEPTAPSSPRSPRPDRTRPDRPADPPPPDMHAQIYRRIAELQGERQSRWQKIFGLVTGGGAAP